MNLNVKGMFNGSKAAADIMVKQGAIVGKDHLRTAKLHQIRIVPPRIRRQINSLIDPFILIP